MIRYKLIFIILFSTFGLVKGQENFKKYPIVIEADKEIINFDKKYLKKLINNCDCEFPKNISVTHIVPIRIIGDYKKSEFINGDNLKKAELIYYKKKLKSNLIIQNDSSLISTGDFKFLMCLNNFKENAFNFNKLLTVFINKEKPQNIFWVNLTSNDVFYFIDINNQLKVLEIKNNKINTYLPDEYFNNHWDEYLPEIAKKLILLYPDKLIKDQIKKQN